MAKPLYQKILIDAWGGRYIPEWTLDAEEMGLASRLQNAWSLQKHVLTGGRQHGVDIVTLDNGRFVLDIVPTRGMGVYEAWYEGQRLGWDSPVNEVVHPQYVNLQEREGLGFLRGFSEWFVRCGLTHNGAPCEDVSVDNQGNETRTMRNLHGRIANLPATLVYVTVDPEPPHALAVHGVVFESTMFGENLRLETVYRTEPGATWVTVEDTVVNLRGVPDRMQMLYHVNYGPPLLEEGARLLVAADRVVPRDAYGAEEIKGWDRYAAPTPGRAERCFFVEPRADRKGTAVHGLVNAAGDLAVSQQYARKRLPCFTVWKNEAAREDGYVTGLEPATNYPNPVVFERKKRRMVNLRPGRSWSSALTIEVHMGRKEVGALKKRVRAVQGKKKIELADGPDPKFCG